MAVGVAGRVVQAPRAKAPITGDATRMAAADEVPATAGEGAPIGLVEASEAAGASIEPRATVRAPRVARAIGTAAAVLATRRRPTGLQAAPTAVGAGPAVPKTAASLPVRTEALASVAA